jgi:hypothetical protein
MNSAYKFIKRQFSQGNAWKDGISTVYVTQKRTSLILFLSAVEIVGGEIWSETDWTERQNVTKHFWQVVAFVPGPDGLDTDGPN